VRGEILDLKDRKSTMDIWGGRGGGGGGEGGGVISSLIFYHSLMYERKGSWGCGEGANFGGTWKHLTLA